MKRHIFIGLFFLIIICVAPVSAQKRLPDFSGTWLYDESKDNKELKRVFESSKKTSDFNKKTINKLVIEQAENEIKITETLSVEISDEKGKVVKKSEKNSPSKIYYADKRGERNLDEKNGLVDSITQWKDKKIIVVLLDKQKNRISTIQFSLSKREQELTVIYSSFNHDNGIVSPSGFGKKVFNKI